MYWKHAWTNFAVLYTLLSIENEMLYAKNMTYNFQENVRLSNRFFFRYAFYFLQSPIKYVWITKVRQIPFSAMRIFISLVKIFSPLICVKSFISGITQVQLRQSGQTGYPGPDAGYPALLTPNSESRHGKYTRIKF
mgnify:CR=1 FL=1